MNPQRRIDDFDDDIEDDIADDPDEDMEEVITGEVRSEDEEEEREYLRAETWTEMQIPKKPVQTVSPKEPSGKPETEKTIAKKEPLRTKGKIEKQTKKKTDKNRIGIKERFQRILQKIRNSFQSILEKIRNIKKSAAQAKAKLDSYLEVWYDDHTQTSFRHIKKELRYLLKHYLPGKLEGRLYFGLSDPAMTGQILGVLSIVQVFTGNHMQITADFERTVLEGDIFLKGHARGFHVIKSAICLVLDKHCRLTYRRLRNFKG